MIDIQLYSAISEEDGKEVYGYPYIDSILFDVRENLTQDERENKAIWKMVVIGEGQFVMTSSEYWGYELKKVQINPETLKVYIKE